MPSDTWPEFLKLLTCGGYVAAAVLPLIVVSVAQCRKLREPLVPRVRPWPVPWSGLDVSLLIAVVVMMPPVVGEMLGQASFFEKIYGQDFTTTPLTTLRESSSASVAGGAAANEVHQQLALRLTVKGLWAGLFAFPFQVGVIILLRTALYPTWRSLPSRPSRTLPARIALASFAWVLLTPAVFLVHFVANALSLELGSSPDDHPLTRIATGGWRLDRVLFVLQACVTAPLMEEWICRGILLPWTTRRSHRTWTVLIAAIAIAGLVGSTAENAVNRFGSAVFLTLILAVWGLLPLLPRGPRGQVRRRRWGGVVASAAIFAALHSSVWPSPVPLFVFALGLGWLALATRGILASVVVHGLFNLISVLYVLGAAG